LKVRKLKVGKDLNIKIEDLKIGKLAVLRLVRFGRRLKNENWEIESLKN
jgi:hypothetical protein